MNEPPQTAGSRRSLARRPAFVVAALVALLVLGRLAGRYVPGFVEHIRSFGALGPLVYVLGYVVAMVTGIPASILTLAAGAIFGLWAGTLWALLGATVGASAAFLGARYVARDLVQKRMAGEVRFQAIDRAIGTDGRRIVFLLRLSPVMPFTLLNYLLGLTPVRFVDFLIGSIGMLPGTVLYVYWGKLAGDVAIASTGVRPPRGVGYYAVLTVGLLATVAVTVLITRLARRALLDTVGDAPAAPYSSDTPRRG